MRCCRTQLSSQRARLSVPMRARVLLTCKAASRDNAATTTPRRHASFKAKLSSILNGAPRGVERAFWPGF